MKYVLILMSFFISTAFAAENQVTICKHGNNERKIEVVYSEGSDACEVQYTKVSGMNVLWTAQVDQNYCVEKAAAFVEKQEGWGWSCTADAAQSSAPVSTEEVATESVDTTPSPAPVSTEEVKTESVDTTQSSAPVNAEEVKTESVE